MKRTISTAILFVTANLSTPLRAQVLDNGAGDYTLETFPSLPNSFTIGTSYSTGSAFSIRGDEMSVPTGNVFETYSLAGNSTYWRMNRNANEYGHFFNLAGESNFNANAPLGHLRWHTWDLLRMQLNGIQNSTINSFTVPTDGFLGLGLSPVANTAPEKPWSRLHMHDASAPGGVVDFGYRDWMRNGVIMTGHGDQMYVGHKYGSGANDATDAVFQWADNGTEQQGPDLMRFIFTSDYTSAVSGENSLFGKEIMQLHPQGRVGIGDWNAASVALGSTVRPTERLDLLDGRLRLRELPDSAQTDSAFKVMVVDDSADPLERGVVKWKDLSALVDCDG